MRLAIVGTGISGLVVAEQLHRHHDLTLFEAGEWVGGHTSTVAFERGGRDYVVDTGFIVFNEQNYPGFLALLARLGVASQPSEMSFSVSDPGRDLEYGARTLGGLFAQRRNLFRPAHWRMLAEIQRFAREAPQTLAGDDHETKLGDWLRARGYSARFIESFIVPMGAAIWSADPLQVLDGFPARYFVQFFHNHGFLRLVGAPRWRTISGGSWSYVKALVRPFADRIRLRTPVTRIVRHEDGVEIEYGPLATRERFDGVVVATHAPDTLRLLADADPIEREVLGAFPYQENDTVLHTDARLMPRRKAAWASWNYLVPPPAQGGRATLTYWMNNLQSIDAPEPFLVTLNRTAAIDPAAIIRRFRYEHPTYTRDGVRAQARWEAVNGVRRTWFCGAYWGYGFHEDGVQSGLRVARSIGSGV